jgi:hypothetical protein
MASDPAMELGLALLVEAADVDKKALVSHVKS